MKRVRLIPRPRIAKPKLTLLNAMDDKNLFRRWFKDEATWDTWRAFIAGFFGLPMTQAQLETYRRCTGRNEAPSQPASEGWLVIGRRGGKSFVMALIAVYLAAFHDYRRYLAPGERGTVLIIATDRRQARIIIRYVRALLSEVPMLARMLERETAEAFDLSNRVTIEVGSASFRTVRGYTIIAALLDEIAFWPSEDSAEPDYEVLNALRPGMATIPNAKLLCASSPYARRGALWDAYRRHFNRNDADALVWQADTRTMNPTVPQRIIDEAMSRDQPRALAEYGAQFRSDVESFIAREAVDACVEAGVREHGALPGIRYHAFVDPSGGSSDSFTLAIGHKSEGVAIVDAVRERKSPFSPTEVVEEFAALLKTYRIAKVHGDRYAGEWPREQFRKAGITYEVAKKAKSDLYRDLLPALNSRKIELLDHDRLINQLVGLERRTSRGGRDSIDHAPGAHDDVANAVAGLCASILTGAGYDTSGDWIGDLEPTRFTFGQRLALYGR